MNNLVAIETLKEKYGAEVVDAEVQKISKQLGAEVVELDESLFVKETKVDPLPTAQVVIQILGLTTELYIAEGRILQLIQLDKESGRKNRYIPPQLRMRLNNLFVNNRKIMDVLHSQFDYSTAEQQNVLANHVEQITNLFVVASSEEREKFILDFLNHLQNKQNPNNDGTDKSREPSGEDSTTN
jgi:hypothetical protein